MAKVRLQIDLTKPRLHWMGYDDDEHGEGRWQSILYEEVLDYCSYCKHQGHAVRNCVIKENDEAAKRKLESNENIQEDGGQDEYSHMCQGRLKAPDNTAE